MRSVHEQRLGRIDVLADCIDCFRIQLVGSIDIRMGCFYIGLFELLFL
jgi:hypothetical protein